MAAALQLDKCCCCINLRIGILILGYLDLIASIIMIGLIGGGMAGVLTNDRPYYVLMTPPTAVIGILYLILLVINIVFNALLLAGVYQRKPSLVKAVWIYAIVYMLMDSGLQLCNPAKQNAPGIIGMIIGLCISIYLALCVRSYELALKEEGFSRPNHAGYV